MALQLGLKRSLLSSQSQKISTLHGFSDVAARRWKSTDAGDVIGIDLGTTNSCVAVMVSPDANQNSIHRRQGNFTGLILVSSYTSLFLRKDVQHVSLKTQREHALLHPLLHSLRTEAVSSVWQHGVRL